MSLFSSLVEKKLALNLYLELISFMMNFSPSSNYYYYYISSDIPGDSLHWFISSSMYFCYLSNRNNYYLFEFC